MGKLTEYTPGPWEVDGPPWNQIVWSSAENRVCFLAHSNGLDDERDIATARLIAAAPDMLDALYQALLYIESDEVTHGRQFGDGNAVRTAIAKATGRADRKARGLCWQCAKPVSECSCPNITHDAGAARSKDPST